MRTTAVIAATALFAATAVTAGAADPAQEPATRQVKIVRAHVGGIGDQPLADVETLEGDRVKIEDAASLLPGESRSYWTDGGREVVITRGEGKRYTVEVEGKTIEIGGDHHELLAAHGGTAHDGTGARRVIIHHETKDGEAPTAEGTTETKDVLVIARAALADAAEDGEPPVIIEMVDGEGGEQDRRVVVLRLKKPADAN